MNRPSPIKSRVTSAFDAASGYDQSAVAQREIAQGLADGIAALGLPRNPAILEIGSGTGFLTTALRRHIADGDWLVTDIAPQMVDRVRAKFAGQADMAFATMDGEALDPGSLDPRGYDLICSSLAMQWFLDLPSAMRRISGLLKPGGRFAFATLGHGSFAEWSRAHADHGVRAGLPDYPDRDAVRAMVPPGFGVAVESFGVVDRHRDGRGFLRSLKSIGASVPREPHQPLSPGTLRRVLATFEAGGASVTYDVIRCIVTRTDG